MSTAEVVLELLANIGIGLFQLASSKTAADRAAAITTMKASIADGEAKLASLAGDLAAQDKVIDAAVDAKYPKGGV